MKSLRHISALILILSCIAGEAQAFTVNTTPLSSSRKDIETLGTGIAIALPVTAAGIAWFKHDRIGLAELAAEGILTVGTAYALTNIVREERPDGSNYQSFPSETTAVAASGSSFLWGRYGWEYGLPAEAAIAAGYGMVLTTPFKRKYNIDTSLEASPDGGAMRFSYNW